MSERMVGKKSVVEDKEGREGDDGGRRACRDVIYILYARGIITTQREHRQCPTHQHASATPGRAASFIRHCCLGSRSRTYSCFYHVDPVVLAPFLQEHMIAGSKKHRSR